MLHANWMARDERTPKQRKDDRVRSLRYEESVLKKRLSEIHSELFELGARGES